MCNPKVCAPLNSLGKAKPTFFQAVEESARKPVVVLDDFQDVAETTHPSQLLLF